MKIWLSEIAKLVHGQLMGDDFLVEGVSIDSRQLKPNDLFIAIKGERFDGHDFIQQVFSQPVAGVLIRKNYEVDAIKDINSFRAILVDEPQKAMTQLAEYWHQKCATKTIGVTGSVGKTTVKEMLAQMAKNQAQFVVTKGNFNNEIGLPLTLFRETEQDQLAILELGASAVGEIARLSKIAHPEVAIITRIGAAHLSGFSSIENICQAKSELFQALPNNGYAIVNMDLPMSNALLQASNHCHQIRVSIAENAHDIADVWPVSIVAKTDKTELTCMVNKQKVEMIIPLPGQHNVMNALLALSGIFVLGYDVELAAKSLSKMTSIAGRLVSHSLQQGTRVIDDTYNANPVSMRAAIDFLVQQPGSKVLVIGDMAELGENACLLHREIGEYAQKNGVNSLLTVGSFGEETQKGFGLGGEHFESKTQLIQSIQNKLTPDTMILIKGSRSAQMEQVVQALVEADKNNYFAKVNS